MSRMVISLASGSFEKLVVASTVSSGGVALEMDVDLYLLLGGAYAFRKDVAGAGTYVDRPDLKDEMLAGMKAGAVPDPIENLRSLKESGKLTIHCCQAAGKIWGAGALEDFVDVVDDIVGIARYITDCEKADVVQVL